MNLSLCLFDESAVRRVLGADARLALSDMAAPAAGQAPLDMRLAEQVGGARPAVGHFYRPVSRPDCLLFTSSSGDGWASLLHRVSQQLLASPPCEAARTAQAPSLALAPLELTGQLSPAGFLMFRLSAQPLLLEFSSQLGLHTRRLVRLMDDSRQRLDFFEQGQPLPFEATERYSARLKRQRLTVAMLQDYAHALGLDGLGDADFHTTQPSLRVTQVWA